MSAQVLEQQVNLFQPIMGAKRRLFSARAIGVALAVLAASLLGLSTYGARRTARLEQTIDAIERREMENLTLTERASQSINPGASLADLDAEAKGLSAAIDSRQHAVENVRRATGTPATGFAARLAAIARREPEGVWLTAIVVSSGEGRLGLRGAATDAALVPTFLAALAQDPAMAGVRFDKLAMRHAKPGESPAQVVFELDAPGLDLQRLERAQ